MARSGGRSFLRLLVAALAMLVAVGAAMPAYARMLGGPPAHACNCQVRGSHASHDDVDGHHDDAGRSACACPLCFPELNEIDTFGAPAVTGHCGNDDPGWRTLSTPAVPTSGFVLAPPLLRVFVFFSPSLSPAQWADRPELPPPRA